MATLLLVTAVAWGACFAVLMGVLVAARWSGAVRAWLFGPPAGNVVLLPMSAGARDTREDVRQAA